MNIQLFPFACALAGALLFGCKGAKPAAPQPAVERSVAPDKKQKENNYTEWLPRHLFNEFVMECDKRDADGSTFWSKGRCVEKIDSRWADGYQQYRIVIGEAPKDKVFHWTWFFDMRRDFFQKKLRELSIEGFQMVSVAHNTTPSGDDSFAAVWHRERGPAPALELPPASPPPSSDAVEPEATPAPAAP